MLMLAGMRIHIARDCVDFRKSIDGLSGVVRSVLRADPLSGHLFVFHNRSRTGLKLLVWNQGGYCLLYKRLAHGRFKVPAIDSSTGYAQMTAAELASLMEGIDLTGARRLKRWNPKNA
jgi:transposase